MRAQKGDPNRRLRRRTCFRRLFWVVILAWIVSASVFLSTAPPALGGTRLQQLRARFWLAARPEGAIAIATPGTRTASARGVPARTAVAAGRPGAPRCGIPRPHRGFLLSAEDPRLTFRRYLGQSPEERATEARKRGGGDPGSPGDKGSASWCRRHVTGWEYLSRYKDPDAQLDVCSRSDAGSRRERAAPAGGGGSGGGSPGGGESSVTCAGVDVPQHERRFMCDARHLTVSFDAASGNAGGESLDSVLGQDEAAEFYALRPGFLSGTCSLHVSPAEMPHPLKELLAAFEGRDGLDCDTWVEQPTLLVKRVEYANVFHVMTDLVAAYAAALVWDVDVATTRLLFLDGHPASPFDAVWKALFSRGHDVLRAREMRGKRVCFNRLLLPAFGYVSPLAINWGRADPCDAPACEWLSGFASWVLRQHGLLDGPPPPDVIRVTALVREDYLAHARQGASHAAHRKFHNLDEVLAAVPRAVGNCSVTVSTVSLTALAFGEQLGAMRNTDVLVAIHGAGLVLEPFLADGAAVIEFYDQGHTGNFHYPNLAKWAGKRHFEWHNHDGANEDPNRVGGHTVGEFLHVDISAHKHLLEKALQAVMDPAG